MTVRRERRLNPVPSPGVLEEKVSAEEAFEAFLNERYGRVVSAVRMITGDRSTAEDMAQEAFARAYVNWTKLWPEGNPVGWVHRVATNLAISWRRSLSREARAVARLSKRTDLVVAPHEAHPELHKAVAGLPKRQRAAVSLHYVLGMSMDECAEAMGCRPGTVKSLLYAARQRLKQELEP